MLHGFYINIAMPHCKQITYNKLFVLIDSSFQRNPLTNGKIEESAKFRSRKMGRKIHFDEFFNSCLMVRIIENLCASIRRQMELKCFYTSKNYLY